MIQKRTLHFIEIYLWNTNVSHNKLKLSRFEDIIPFFKDKFNTNCIPNMILIDDSEHKEYNTRLNVIRVNYDMSNISEIFI